MNLQEVKSYFKKVVDDIVKIGGVNKTKAFDILLDFIAVKVNIKNSMIKAHYSIYNYLNTIDIDKFRNIKYDFIGECCRELNIRDISCINKNKTKKYYEEIKEILSDDMIEKNHFPKALLIDEVHTNSIAFDILHKIEANVILYCTTKNKDDYKIALVNAGLNNMLNSIFILLLEDNEIPKDTGDPIWNNTNIWIQR